MLRNNLIAAVKKAKGTIYVATVNKDDVYYVRVVKHDLVEMLRDMPEGETGFDIRRGKNGEGWYFDRDYINEH